MKIGDGFKTRLEFVLEEALESLSYGGDHVTRAFVASRPLKAAQSGILKLEDLMRIAHDALFELLQPPKPTEVPHQRLEQNALDFPPG
jgi:hypothetical protein